MANPTVVVVPARSSRTAAKAPAAAAAAASAPRTRTASSSSASSFLYLVVIMSLLVSPAHSGRSWLPQGDQSTLLCRCQAVYEDLYPGQGPGEGPNDRRDRHQRRRRELQQVDDNGYIVIDGITVLPDTRPVCQDTRQRKRAAGVYRRRHRRTLKQRQRHQAKQQMSKKEHKAREKHKHKKELFQSDSEDAKEETLEGDELDASAGSEDGDEDEDMEEDVHGWDVEEEEDGAQVDEEEAEDGATPGVGGTAAAQRQRRRLASRSLKGSKGGGGKGGGKGGGGGSSKGGGGGGGGKGKGGSWGWGWHSGKGGGGGGSKGGKGGSDDWGWGKGGKGKGGKGKGKGGGNPNWRPPVFPCPRPPNNAAPTPTPGSPAPTSQIITAPTPTPTSNVVAPTLPPNPLVPTTDEPTVGTDIPTQDITAEPTLTNFPTTGGTDAPTVTQFPTTGTESPTLGTDAPTASQVATGQPTEPQTATPTSGPSQAPSQGPSSLAPIPLNRRDDDPCVVSTGIQCTTFRGRSCQDLFKPSTLVCETPRTELSFLFIPDTCNDLDGTTAVSGTNCTDDLAFVDGEFMIQCEGWNNGTGLVASPMLVTPGDTFSVRTADNGTLPEQITCTVFENFGRSTQHVSFDATINPNVYTLKTRVGSLTLQGCGAKYCIEHVVYRYEVSNDGNAPMTVTDLTLTETGGLHRQNDDLQCKLDPTRLGPQEAATIEETQTIDLCGLCEYEAILRVKGTPYPNNGNPCQAQSVYRLNIEAPPGTS